MVWDIIVYFEKKTTKKIILVTTCKDFLIIMQYISIMFKKKQENYLAKLFCKTIS